MESFHARLRDELLNAEIHPNLGLDLRGRQIAESPLARRVQPPSPAFVAGVGPAGGLRGVAGGGAPGGGGPPPPPPPPTHPQPTQTPPPHAPHPPPPPLPPLSLSGTQIVTGRTRVRGHACMRVQRGTQMRAHKHALARSPYFSSTSKICAAQGSKNKSIPLAVLQARRDACAHACEFVAHALRRVYLARPCSLVCSVRVCAALHAARDRYVLVKASPSMSAVRGPRRSLRKHMRPASSSEMVLAPVPHSVTAMRTLRGMGE